MSVAPSPSTEIDAELRRPLLRELRAALARTHSSQSGEVVFCRGQPGSGRTTVLLQFLAELGADAKDTDVLAGGFARPGSPPGLALWRVLSPGLKLLTATNRIASGLGDAIQTAAVAAAVADPTGAARLFTSVATLLGQSTTTAAHGGEQLARGQQAHHPEAVSAAAVAHAVRYSLARRRRVILVLDDLHLAEPAVEWCSVLIERWLAPLLSTAPFLLLLSFADAVPTDDLSELERQAGTGIARALPASRRFEDARRSTVTVTSLSRADIAQWLSPVDPDICRDLHACTNGHPGWVVALVREWENLHAVDGWQAWSLVDQHGAATRIIFAARALQEHVDRNTVISCLLLGYEMCDNVAANWSRLDIELLQAHALLTIAHCTYGLSWFGDSLGCAGRARDLFAGFEDAAYAFSAGVSLVGAYGRLISLVRHGMEGAFAGAIAPQLPLQFPTVLPKPKEIDLCDEDTVANVLARAAEALITEGRSLHDQRRSSEAP